MLSLKEAIALRLKELLDERGKKPYYLFKYGGMSRTTISNILNCKINNVSSDILYQICSVLEINLKTFFDSPLFDEISN